MAECLRCNVMLGVDKTVIAKMRCCNGNLGCGKQQLCQGIIQLMGGGCQDHVVLVISKAMGATRWC